VTSRPGVSHSAGVTYWRWTAYTSGSSAPQLSHVDVTGTASTLTPTVTAVSWGLRAAVALVLAVAACGDDDAAPALTTAAPVASTPPSAAPSSAATTNAPVPTAPTTTEAAPTTTSVVPVGFETVAGRVTAADGSTCDVCLWAASTPAEEARGLMGVTDLGGADGMVFRFASPVTTQFWMRDTVMPLSIAFYASDGSFVSATDMEPCLTGPADACARYAAAAPYVNAIEVPEGGLEALLMTEGSRLELSEITCPLQNR
jgi:uncharacterized membrane protein (UPF0127 family)